MMGILSGAAPLMVDVRQTDASPASTGSDLPSRRRNCRFGPIDLHHRDPGAGEVPGQPSPVRAGALHADEVDLAMAAQPLDQPPALRRGRVERLDAEHPANVVDHRGHVYVCVRVNTRGHRTCRLYDGHRHPFLFHWVQGVARTCREGAGNPGLLAQTRTQFPTRPVSAVPGPADESFARQRDVSADS
jgi:hypothetical protein